MSILYGGANDQEHMRDARSACFSNSGGSCLEIPSLAGRMVTVRALAVISRQEGKVPSHHRCHLKPSFLVAPFWSGPGLAGEFVKGAIPEMHIFRVGFMKLVSAE
ncbi:hypothetical protein HL42_2619 [Trichophyton rubrum]|nr:hypothetical protein HL42_2619 [Trichophyton rubrum]